MPAILYAVVDLYGKCVKISITHPIEREINNDECLSCDSADSECEVWINSLIDDFRNVRLQAKQNVHNGPRVPVEDLDVPISKYFKRLIDGSYHIYMNYNSFYSNKHNL